MRKKLLIVGAGGFGREILSYAQKIPQENRDWEILGFLDDNQKALEGFNYSYPLVSTVSQYQPQPDHVLVMAIGSPKIKMLLAESLQSRGAQFISFIHPTAQIGANAKIGNGAVICPFVSITCDLVIGEFVTINTACTIGHDTRIGNGATLSGHVDLTGNAQLGRQVFVGSRASILPGVRVGDHATVGAGSIVIRHVKEGVTVFTPPAKQL